MLMTLRCWSPATGDSMLPPWSQILDLDGSTSVYPQVGIPKSYQFFKRDLLDKVLIFGSKTISLRHLIVRTPRTQGSSAVHGSILG